MRADWDGGAVAVCRVGGQRGAAPDTNADGSKHAQSRIEGRVLTDGDVEDVGLQLHQQLVGRHPAVHLQLRQPHAAVLVHGLHDLRDTQSARAAARTHGNLEILDYLALALVVSLIFDFLFA